MILKGWSLALQHQHLLGRYWKCTFLGPNEALQIRTLGIKLNTQKLCSNKLFRGCLLKFEKHWSRKINKTSLPCIASVALQMYLGAKGREIRGRRKPEVEWRGGKITEACGERWRGKRKGVGEERLIHLEISWEWNGFMISAGRCHSNRYVSSHHPCSAPQDRQALDTPTLRPELCRRI